MAQVTLGPEFFAQETLELARALLGKHLVRNVGDHTLCGRIVEVEAYHQDGDAAAHSFNGETPRNAVMFGPPGFLYVYFIYGVHYCMNVVTEEAGVGAAVLIRGIEPLAGTSYMQQQRGPKIKGENLTNGPAKCCQAFNIGPSENGLCLTGNSVYLQTPATSAMEAIATSPRIGISKATELPWRFYLEGNPYVSKPPRSFRHHR